jgi:hypothetical protein
VLSSPWPSAVYCEIRETLYFQSYLTRAQISWRQTSGLTQGSPPFYITNAGGEPRVKSGVWRPEMWAQEAM